MAWELTKVLQLPTGAFQLESVFKIIVGLHLSDWQASFSALAQTCLLNQNADRWHTSDLQLQTVLLICRYSVMRGPMIHQEKFKNTRGTLTRLLLRKNPFLGVFAEVPIRQQGPSLTVLKIPKLEDPLVKGHVCPAPEHRSLAPCLTLLSFFSLYNHCLKDPGWTHCRKGDSVSGTQSLSAAHKFE